MKAHPAGLEQPELIRELEDGWSIHVAAVEYVAEGFGSYHWVVVDTGGTRHFATADALDTKPWLGDNPESVFSGLMRAFDTAVALRGPGGLEFVVAPRPSSGGETVRRLGPRYSIALFPFIEVVPGDVTPAERDDGAEVVEMLARLHGATPVVARAAPRHHLELSGRARLEEALGDLETTWHGGPYAEPARTLVANHAGTVDRLLHAFDRLVAQVSTSDGELVVTHGEPHPGNLVSTQQGLVLVDWDTVGVARPERDLWMVATESGDELDRYSHATGTPVDAAALTLYRLRWDLEEMSTYISQFRRPHTDDEDTDLAWLVFTRYIESDDRWDSVLGEGP